MRSNFLLRILAALSLATCGQAAAQSVITQAGELSLDVSDEREELVFNLLGDLWTVPNTGGVARLLAESPLPAARPSWSPDSRRIVFETNGSSLRILDVESGQQRSLTPENAVARFPSWHPSGERLVYASRRGGEDFDLWETDLATGLSWRLSDGPGDDIEPDWSADGRNLVWVRQSGDEFQLMLRRFGQPEEILVSSTSELHAPSWRPDGTLITFFRRLEDEFRLQMIILSDPPLERTLIREDELYPVPVAWLDRSRLYYSAQKRIKSRDFDDWSGRIVPFRASLEAPEVKPSFTVASRDLPVTTPAEDRMVIRAGRIFDGYSRTYREAADVLIEAGRIADVTARKDWGDIPVIDLSSTTLLPGLIDLYADLPTRRTDGLGATFLSWGVTTIVATPPAGFDPAIWETEEQPGPRLLEARLLEAPADDTDPDGTLPFLVVDATGGNVRAADNDAVSAWQSRGVPVLSTTWRRADRLKTALFTAGDSIMPASIGGIRAGRVDRGDQVFDLTTRQLVSALADRATPGLEALFDARQAVGIDSPLPWDERRSLMGDLRRSRAPVALASAPNGMPPGLATHAELLALAGAQLPNDQVLKAAGRQAAAMLGLAGELGEISVGAHADLVLVAGDPLARLSDLRNIVAVVRNGRFYSLVNLLERRESVE